MSHERKISLCYTYDSNDIRLLHTIQDYVEFIETTPDTIAYINQEGIAELNPEIVNQLLQLSESKKIIAHGVGLSIGTYDGMNNGYLSLLNDLYAKVPLHWHSEHLGYTMVDGAYVNVMLPINRNEENLNLICNRVKEIQQTYKLPFLLENIAHLIPDYDAQYTDAGFLNAIVSQTGCGLILDMYNIACDAYNYNFNIDSFLSELNLSAVKEIHLANGSVYKNKMLDIHSNTVSDEVLERTAEIVEALGNLEVITFELMPEAVQRVGYSGIEMELIRLRKYFNLN